MINNINDSLLPYLTGPIKSAKNIYNKINTTKQLKRIADELQEFNEPKQSEILPYSNVELSLIVEDKQNVKMHIKGNYVINSATFQIKIKVQNKQGQSNRLELITKDDNTNIFSGFEDTKKTYTHNYTTLSTPLTVYSDTKSDTLEAIHKELYLLEVNSQNNQLNIYYIELFIDPIAKSFVKGKIKISLQQNETMTAQLKDQYINESPDKLTKLLEIYPNKPIKSINAKYRLVDELDLSLNKNQLKSFGLPTSKIPKQTNKDTILDNIKKLKQSIKKAQLNN